ncbi:MAG TPA: hypothetical protein VIF09_08390 [Polyangiaceae bacterium]
MSADSQVMRPARSPGVTTLAHERVTRAREVLSCMLDAFSGLELMDLLPGSKGQESTTDAVLEAFTESNAASVIGSLESWAAAHPTRGFEVALLMPPLRDLAQELGRTPG